MTKSEELIALAHRSIMDDKRWSGLDTQLHLVTQRLIKEYEEAIYHVMRLERTIHDLTK